MGKENVSALTRRSFLKIGAFGLGGLVLTACTPIESAIRPLSTINPEIPETPLDTSTPPPAPTRVEATQIEAPTITPIEEQRSLVESLPFNPNQTIPVIEYHYPLFRMNDSTLMTPELYEGQLQLLSELAFYTPTVEEILGWLDGTHGLPTRSIILRIDLGSPFKSYEQSLELMREYGFKTIVFIGPRYIPDTGDEHHIGWDFIQAYLDNGTIIPGSHGIHHYDYTTISAAQAVRDAVDAKEIIEQKLGKDVYFFAFPFDAEAHAEELLEYFRMVFGSNTQVAKAGDPVAGSLYPYFRANGFDWEAFQERLLQLAQNP